MNVGHGGRGLTRGLATSKMILDLIGGGKESEGVSPKRFKMKK
jgi:glycine/D-amino acid oxidase-like deaminating enzyme